MIKTLVLAGGTGFVGQIFESHATAHGYRCLILTRRPVRENEIYWDGSTIDEWAGYLEDAVAVINFAGHSVDCIHNERNRNAILQSRIDSVNAIAQAIQQCEAPPQVWIQSSAVGIFGNTSEICDENAPLGDDFMAEVCKAWEVSCLDNDTNIRKCCFRFGIVLGANGGALKPLRTLSRLLLGGTAGSGNQWMSWIHEEDVCRIILETIENESMSGAYNVTGPTPMKNRDFMAQVRRALNRPWSPPAPSFAVTIGARFLLNTDPTLALHGQRVIPKRLTDMDFEFKYPELADALTDIFSRWR